MLYYSWDMVHDRLFFILGCFLPFYHLTAQKNQTFNKVKKNAWIHHHFTHVQQKLWSDRRTDGWKEWHIEVGASPRENQYFKQSATVFGLKKKRNCNPNPLIQTFVYRSNIYYSKTDQRGNWKHNSSTLHLD